jgi:hypothetical protein
MKQPSKNIAYLLHITHYDPKWIKEKPLEQSFDFELACEIIETLKTEGFNTLVIDIADGVIYKSHPELKKHYSVPMNTLRDMAEKAHSAGLEVIPKLNFSKSEINMHDNWGRKPGALWNEDFDDFEAYYKKAFECIDEVIAACKPCNKFHIGMDEDHTRSYSQYCEAIEAFHLKLKERGLRTIIWNDMAIPYPNGHIFVEKSLAALERTPKDVIHVLWDYKGFPQEASQKILDSGFELWGAPGRDPEQAQICLDFLKEKNASGALMTTWTKCIKENRNLLLEDIQKMGPIYRRMQSSMRT